MNNKLIKLIWDFRGPAAAKTAEHHELHLKEYIKSENLRYSITGNTSVNHLYSFAYMVVAESEMIPVRDSLKPHRGEIYNS